MDALPKNVWKRLSRLFPAEKGQAAQAAAMFREYEPRGYLGGPAAQILKSDLPVTVDFFRRVALMHSGESPILRRRDTRWMSEFDYTLMNIRASGTDGKPGNFLSGALFLTMIRTRGIILAPVTRGATENLLALESHAVLRADLADPVALEAGLGPEVQMAAFCEAAHLLGLVLGFDLDYRVDPLAAVVLNRPDLFFWTKSGGFDPTEETQNELRDEVRSRVASVRKTGVSVQREVFGSSLSMTGLAALPSSDNSGRTSLAFRYGSADETGAPREEAVAYWGRVFDLWRDRYGFDFLVLRGTREGDSPSADIPDRSLVRKAADAARKAGVRRNIGVAAEGDSVEVESFGVQGIDLVLDDDADAKADRLWFDEAFALDERLRRVNLGRKLRFSVPLAVDPGDVDSKPRRERALIKRFVARFLGTGPSRRPLLETMGALEGAFGYRNALSSAVSMGWMPDAGDAERGRCLEEVAETYAEMIEGGERLDRHVGSRAAWWVIRSKRGLLIAIISVENEDLLPPEPIRIDYASYLKDTEAMTVLEFDFREDRGLLQLSADTVLNVSGVPYRGFRLYVIT